MSIRNVEIQNDSMRFRRNMERIGEIFSYEISKKMDYTNTKITTPLGESWENVISEKPVLATILRAGLPLHQGFLNYFDDAENSFISAHRKYKIDGDFEIINRKWKVLGKLFKKKNMSRKECILLPFKTLKKIVSD